MATRYHLDLYPRTDPRDGTRIRRFNKLQRATFRDVVGVGSGAAVIRSTDAEADDLDPLGEQYVRVVREDTDDFSQNVVGGFWINRYNHDTAVARQTKRLTFAGAGTMAYLARARMAPHSYLNEFMAFTPQDPFDDIWRLHAQGPPGQVGTLGAMAWRVLIEALNYRSGATYTHRHKDGEVYTDSHADDRTGGSAIEFATLGFDWDEDSNGNPWSATCGEFTASIGENVLSVLQRLMQAGLYLEMDPDTFEVRAWENAEHRRDRTGGAWGTNVVRFQAPTDATVATGNMLNDSEREINSHLKRTLVWAGGQDMYAKSTGSGDIRWEGFEPSTAEESTALQQIASTQITAREEAADAGSVRMKLGKTPLSGRYRPWEEVRLDDLVTLDTGSGVWDYTEDTYPVAGLRIELQKSGAWWAWAELGASQPSLADRRFAVAAVGAHTHSPNPELCRLGTPAVGNTVHFTRTWDYEGGDLDSTSNDYPWGDVLNGASTTAFGGSNFGRSSGGTGSRSPRMPCIPGGEVVFTGSIARHFFTDTFVVKKYLLQWYATIGGPVIADELLSPAACARHTAAAYSFTRTAPSTATYFTLKLDDNAAHDDVTVTSYDTDATPGISGELPLDTVHQGEESVGTSVRAARCDHEHAHGLLSSDEEDYHAAYQVEYDDGVTGLGTDTVQDALETHILDDASHAGGGGLALPLIGWPSDFSGGADTDFTLGSAGVYVPTAGAAGTITLLETAVGANKYQYSAKGLLVQTGTNILQGHNVTHTLADGDVLVAYVCPGVPNLGDNMAVALRLSNAGGEWIQSMLEQDTGNYNAQGNSDSNATGASAGANVSNGGGVLFAISRVGLLYATWVSTDGGSWRYLYSETFSAQHTVVELRHQMHTSNPTLYMPTTRWLFVKQVSPTNLMVGNW